jgi:hypothetical protein
MARKYLVRLSSEERTDLTNFVIKGKAGAYKRLHGKSGYALQGLRLNNKPVNVQETIFDKHW